MHYYCDISISFMAVSLFLIMDSKIWFSRISNFAQPFACHFLTPLSPVPQPWTVNQCKLIDIIWWGKDTNV